MTRTLPLLALANFAAATAGMIIAGILQLIATDLNWTPAEAGRLITWYALGFAVGAPLLGALLGTMCRKQMVVRGLLLVAAGSVATAFATQALWLDLARLVVAAGAAMVVPSTSAIAAWLNPDDRPRALATVLMGMTAAVVFGLPAGTLLAASFGWQAPLVAAGVVAALVSLAIKRLLPGGIVVPPVSLGTWKSLLAAGRTYGLIAPSVIVAAANFSLYAYIGPFLEQTVGVGAQGLSWMLLWFGIVSFAANSVLGPLSHRLGARRLLMLSVALLAVALALSHWGERSGTYGVWLLVVLFALWAVAGAFFGTLQQARVVEAAPSTAPALLALNTSAMFVGQAVGTTAGGLALAAGGVGALPFTAALLAALALAWLWGSKPAPAAEPAGTPG